MLVQNVITENGIKTIDKVKVAIEQIKFAAKVSEHQGKGALYVAFSGGKDSVCVAELCRLAEVDYELHYHVTTVDPPDLIRFIAKNYPDLIWDKPKKSMWKLIVSKKMPPTRLVRYCCSELKEGGGENRICLTGVRRAESVKRNNRRAYEIVTSKASEKILFNDNDEDRRSWENCTLKGEQVCNPIIDWTESDVWEFINARNLPYCKLYDEGWKRIGCIGCPMAPTREREKGLARYPFYRSKYIKAFEDMLKEHGEDKDLMWKSGEDVMRWWLYGSNKINKNQISIDNLFEEEH